MRPALLFIGTIALGFLHLVCYTRVVPWRLWELTGGIREEGQLTHIGTSAWAWTVPFHLPAGLLFAVNADFFGMVAVFTGSLAAGFAAARLIVDLCNRERHGVYMWYWRLGWFLAGWLWILVPSKISWIYHWTVVY